VLLVTAATVGAQSTTVGPEPRRFSVGANIGYGRTWDDEGLLGEGSAASLAASINLTRRLTIRAVVDRVPYKSDRPWLRIDGRAIFIGGESVFHFGRRSSRPYLFVGLGALIHEDEWLWKRDGLRYDRRGSLVAASLGTGIEIGLSPMLSICPELRLYSKVSAGEDLDPHLVIRPGASILMKW
jgi:hypothetical protein